MVRIRVPTGASVLATAQEVHGEAAILSSMRTSRAHIDPKRTIVSLKLLSLQGGFMPQLFHPAMNTVARVSIFGALFLAAAGLGLLLILIRSPYATEVGVVREQPIPFSHEHHVGDIGLDCRYCHTSVEQTAFAGIPATSICMNCHSQLFADSAILATVRESSQTGQPIQWTRVHDLPDFVYFNHSIHVHKGVACTTCHGPVNEMPLMWREHTLHMQWCLDCHRDPQKFVGSPSDVFSAGLPDTNRLDDEQILPTKKVNSETSCYTCHR